MNIKISDIEKRFGSHIALESISLELFDKEFTTLLGPSGCGKTTLLRIIAGLEEPDGGELYFDDRCIYSKEKQINLPPEMRGLAFVFQDLALWPHMTVFENVAFGLKATGQTKQVTDKVRDALSAVRLSDYEKQYPHQLSGGQQQRVAFARAIAVNPRCILFDEPLSALDAILREEMRGEIKRLVAERSITAVFVTHDQLEAMSMSDRIAVFEKGKIVQLGSPEEIYYRPNSISVAKFVGRSNWLSDRLMIRPENIRINEMPERNKSYEQFTMKVKDIRFMGNHYEVVIEDEINSWCILSSQKYVPNEKVTVYIEEAALLKF